MADLATSSPDVGTLAWEGDRLSVHDLTERERKMLDGIAEFLFREWPVEPPDPEDFVEREEFDEQREAVALFAKLLDVTVTDEDDEEAIEAKVKERLEQERAEGVKDATVPSRANTAERKAMRLLIERRVVVLKIAPEGLVHARVRGDSGELYDCGYDPARRQYRCTCPEMRGQCSHLLALKMVTATKGAERT